MEAKRNSAPGEGLTPEAALPGCPHEPRAHICRACYAAALLAAEARGLERAADVCREHWRGLILNDGAHAAATYLERKLRAMALAPAAPKAAPPADALRKVLLDARACTRELEMLAPGRWDYASLIDGLDHALARSAPPAPAAPKALAADDAADSLCPDGCLCPEHQPAPPKATR